MIKEKNGGSQPLDPTEAGGGRVPAHRGGCSGGGPTTGWQVRYFDYDMSEVTGDMS